jgi:hypothetical protein
MGILEEALVAYTYVGVWISLSAGVILYNKYILTVFGFPFPVALTMIHMTFCSSLAGMGNEGGGGVALTPYTVHPIVHLTYIGATQLMIPCV